MDTESVVSSVSSITPQTRGTQVSTDTAPHRGNMSLFGGGNLITIVHILSEITVFVAMGMWVRSRTNSLQKQVNDLRDIVEQQTAVINDHTEALQMLMNSRAQPSYFSPAGNIVRPPVSSQQTTVDSSEPVNNFADQSPPNAMPPDFMSLSVPNTPEDPEDQEVPRVQMLSPIDETTESADSDENAGDDTIETDSNENELDQELEKELAALQ